MARLWRLVPLDQAVKRLLLAGLVALSSIASPAVRSADRAGDFDFYVLALTWSPSYCENARRPDAAQCDLEPPGFVVHGLWPQYERGFPLYCDGNVPRRLPQGSIARIADVIPSPGAAQYQWQKHGICSGLRPENYFSLMRRAKEAVVIPEDYVETTRDLRASPQTIESDFVAANPGMSEYGIATTCNREGIIEVRICLTRRLDFRRCAEVDRRACRRSSIKLEAVD